MSKQTHRTNVVPLRVPSPATESIQGTLALDLLPRHEPPSVAPPGPVAAESAGDVIGIDRGVRRQVEQWARRYAQAAVEIVGGDRPATQLVRWTSREVFLDLQRRAVLVARAGNHRPGEGRVQPVRPQVVGSRACFLSRRVAEVGLRIRYGERSRALAARFELRDGRWQCTALDFS